MADSVTSSLEETRVWLEARAHRAFRPIPAEVIAEHVLKLTEGGDFAVRRAALEALLRRRNNASTEELVVLLGPPRAVLGRYVIGRKVTRAVRGQKTLTRPYVTTVRGLRPLVGDCTCPDYLKGSLGLCKHLLTAFAEIYASARRVTLGMQQPSPTPQPLDWDPVLPLTGPGDRLLGLRWTSSKTPPSDFDPATLRLETTAWGSPEPRRSLLERLLVHVNPRRKDASAAVRTLLEEERETVLRSLSARRASLRAHPHLDTVKRPLFPYQREGVERFLERGRLLLADDMGLGKTTQAIAACHALFHAQVIRGGLVITPASLKLQWLREWESVSDVPATVVDGSSSERLAIYRKHRRGFLILNYELLLKDFQHVAPLGRQCVVLDEAQRIKNYATKSAVTVKALPAEYRLVLTGTPMENHLEELASLLDWVDDRALQPKWRLTAWHIRYGGEGHTTRLGARNLDTLRERLAPALLRRVRSEVLTQLPRRTDTRVPVAMTPEQRLEHDDLSPSIARLAARAAIRPLTQADFLRLMQLLTTQRMIANGLGQLRFDALWPTLSGKVPSRALRDGLFCPKLEELRNLLESLVLEQGRKVVVFSQWRRMLCLAHWATSDLLAQADKTARFFTGTENARTRSANVVEFHDDPRVGVLFLSDAGGVGLNLQRAASACINLELPWNPAVLEQRIGRIYRLGQKRPIDVYNLISEPSIESRIAGIVGTKQALFKGLFDGTTNELNFTEGSGFIAEVRRLLDVTVPTAPTLPSESLATEEELEAEIDMRPLESVDGSAVREQTSSLPPPAVLLDQQAVAQLLSRLDVRRDDTGRLTVSAPPEVANTLATMLESMVQLLRAGSEGQGNGEG